MAKQSAYMRRVQAQHEQMMLVQRSFTIIQCRDMAAIALHEAFGFGPERLAKFLETYDAVLNEYADMAVSDSEDDPEIDYTKGKVDAHLKRILGDGFVPWEERYREIAKYIRR